MVGRLADQRIKESRDPFGRLRRALQKKCGVRLNLSFSRVRLRRDKNPTNLGLTNSVSRTNCLKIQTKKHEIQQQEESSEFHAFSRTDLQRSGEKIGSLLIFSQNYEFFGNWFEVY